MLKPANQLHTIAGKHREYFLFIYLTQIPHSEVCVISGCLSSVFSLSPFVSVIVGGVSLDTFVSRVEMPQTPAVVNCSFVLSVTTADDYGLCSGTTHSRNDH